MSLSLTSTPTPHFNHKTLDIKGHVRTSICLAEPTSNLKTQNYFFKTQCHLTTLTATHQHLTLITKYLLTTKYTLGLASDRTHTSDILVSLSLTLTPTPYFNHKIL